MLTALLATFCVQGDAIQVLKDLALTYRTLDSLSVTIEHHDSSGLFPGEYTQELKWKKGNRFELRVTSANPKNPTSPGSRAPDYYCDGSQVTSVAPGTPRPPRPLNTDPNISPGYEVSAGVILSFLLDSPNVKLYLDPPAALGMKWSLGPATAWKGDRAKQLLLTVSREGQTVTGTFYYAESPLRMLGMEFKAPTQSGWMRYKDQKTNPKLPNTLGDPPTPSIPTPAGAVSH